MTLYPGQLCFICPVFLPDAWSREVTLRCVKSFHRHTPGGQMCLAYDDASPDWDEDFAYQLEKVNSGMVVEHFPDNGGLTRSWNYGLADARKMGCKWVLTGNNDLIFTPGWYEALLWQLENTDLKLVGPVTNAPGFGNQGAQNVKHYCPNYRLSDREEDLAEVAEFLKSRYSVETAVDLPPNGFCLLARISTWFEGAFSAQHVFDPRKRMAGNEDELEKRWKQRGWRIGFCPGSFVFHYRSVARGLRYLTPGHYRPSVVSL